MEWYNKLQEKCHDLKIEFITDQENKKLVFFCAKMPPEKEKKELITLIPSSLSADFVEGPKNKTLHAIQIYLLQAGIVPTHISLMGHKLILDVNSMVKTMPDEDHPFWDAMNTILEKDGFFDQWEIIINNEKHGFNLRVSEDIQKNKNLRDYCITQEEIKDLHILLNDPSMTWDKLMEML